MSLINKTSEMIKRFDNTLKFTNALFHIVVNMENNMVITSNGYSPMKEY